MKISDKLLVLIFGLSVIGTYLGICVEYMLQLPSWPYIIVTETIGIIIVGITGLKILLRLTKF